MTNEGQVPVIYYEAERIPDNRPGAGKVSYSQFLKVREAIVSVCRQHGATGPEQSRNPDYYVIDDQYNEERYQYVEVLKSSAVSRAWLLDLMAALHKHKNWGAGIKNIGEGYILAFADRLMVTGPTFQGARTLDDVVERARRALELATLIKNCATDDDLARLAQVPGIERISMALQLKEVTDAGFALLEGLRGLSSLSVSGQVTDRGLAHLRDLKQLTSLSFWGLRITGSGLQHLAGLEHLNDLVFSSAAITDNSLAYLAPFRRLKSLLLSGSPVSDDGLGHLTPLAPTLKRLILRATNITDAGLRHIAKLTALNELDLTHTQVSDEGIQHLHMLTSLRTLCLDDTHVTQKGIKRLLARLPNPQAVRVQFLLAPSEDYHHAAAAFEQLGGTVLLQESEKGRSKSSVFLQDEWQGNDAGLALLLRLGEVTSIAIETPKFTDLSLAHASKVLSLEGIHFEGSVISADGLAHLQKLPLVERLYFGKMVLDAKFLTAIGLLPRIKTLTLNECSVSESDLELLGSLNRLEQLDLSGSSISPKGIAALKRRLPKCEVENRL
jgi:internalin A